MKTTKSGLKMSMDAYAGFLRLMLKPAEDVANMTDDVREYLNWAERREPLSGDARRAMGHSTDRAA